VKVRGRDRNGNPFTQTTQTVNVSRRGACLDNIPCAPGEVIELGRWWRKARYRVVWTGDPGTPLAHRIGVCTLDPGQNIWGLDFASIPHTIPSAPPVKPAPAPPHPSAAEPGGEPGGPAVEYEVFLRCPYGDEERWERLPARRETLEQIQNIHWDLDCPTHGPQRLLPLRARKAESPAVVAAPAPRKPGVNTRSSPRVPRRVPLLVQGATPEGRTFLEEASTLLVNANGGLVELGVSLSVGQTVNVVNRDSKLTEVCRVAYVGPDASGRCRVGIAFRRPAGDFWGA
jgi:hypothetical protein